MKRMRTNYPVWIVASSLTIMVGGCGHGPASPTLEESRPTAPAASDSIARHIVNANAAADERFHLVARKYLTNETQVVEFYEPQPGVIWISGAGRPEIGTAVTPATVANKTAAEVWDLVAPGEAMPRLLSDAVARAQEGPTAAITTTQVSAPEPAVAKTVASRIPVQVASPHGGEGTAPTREAPARAGEVVPLISGNGYCSGQFWNDFASFGTGSNDYNRQAVTTNYGYYTTNYSNVVWSGWAVCPQVQGGIFGSDRNSGWWVDPNYYRWLTTGSSRSCGWDWGCLGSEPRCTPNYQNTSMSFFSNCFLTTGTSCGYDYDWLTFYNWTGSYCSGQSPACGETTIGEAPPCCPTNPPCTGDGICSTDPQTGFRFCCDPKIGHCP